MEKNLRYLQFNLSENLTASKFNTKKGLIMRKIFALLFAAVMLSSCAAYVASPLTGFLYTDVKAPLAVTNHDAATKVGTAKAQSILGIVATGDASIEAAARSAGITKIHHVDYQGTSILGIIATFTVYVYGE